MGRIARLLKTEIEKFIVQTVEMYFGANVTAETFAPSGDDSPPLADDRIVLVKVDGTGNFAAVGVLSVSQGAKAGEKILYSRDENGEVKAAIKLLNDGKIEMISPAEFSMTAEKKYSVESKDAMSFKGKGVTVESEDSMSLKGTDVTVEGQSSLTLKSPATELTGGSVKCKGNAIPDGTGCFCGVPYCLYSGAPQTGTNVTGS